MKKLFYILVFSLLTWTACYAAWNASAWSVDSWGSGVWGITSEDETGTYWVTANTDLWSTAHGTRWTVTYNTEIP